VTIRFLKQVDEAGQDCQWIEYEARAPSENNLEDVYVRKVLVPISMLREDAAPILHSLRNWQTYGDERPTMKEGIGQISANDLLNSSLGFWFVFLPGARQLQTEHSEMATIDYQRGTLHCESLNSGVHEAVYASPEGGQNIHSRAYQLRLHEDLPCGFAWARMSLSYSHKSSDGTVEGPYEQFVEELILQDFGTDGASALPDHW
jgi:hypothetical protein